MSTIKLLPDCFGVNHFSDHEYCKIVIASRIRMMEQVLKANDRLNLFDVVYYFNVYQTGDKIERAWVETGWDESDEEIKYETDFFPDVIFLHLNNHPID